MTHPYKTREGGATVTIFVPYDCRNHCPFCVNKQEYAHAEGFSVEAILKSIAVMDEITPRFPVQPGCSAEEMIAFTERNRDKITCINISRHLTKYVEESPDEVVARIATPKRVNCVLYMDYPADELVDYAERWRKYNIPVQFRYDYTENLYQEEGDKILADLKKRFTYKGLDGFRMRNGYHFDYKGLHMTYHKTLPYSTIVETGDDGVTYDILYDILIKQTGEIHSDWTGVKLDVDAYRKVVYEPYDLRVREGTIDF